jgi:hypothetical protein
VGSYVGGRYGRFSRILTSLTTSRPCASIRKMVRVIVFPSIFFTIVIAPGLVTLPLMVIEKGYRGHQ